MYIPDEFDAVERVIVLKFPEKMMIAFERSDGSYLTEPQGDDFQKLSHGQDEVEAILLFFQRLKLPFQIEHMTNESASYKRMRQETA